MKKIMKNQIFYQYKSTIIVEKFKNFRILSFTHKKYNINLKNRNSQMIVRYF